MPGLTRWFAIVGLLWAGRAQGETVAPTAVAAVAPAAVAAVAPAAGAAAPGAAAPAGAPAGVGARVFHQPPSAVPEGQAVRIDAAISDAWQEPSIEVRYRALGGTEYEAAPFERSTAGGYRASIPALALATGGVEYYIVGTDRSGGEHAHFASAEAPHRVLATASASDARADLERRLVGGRLSLFRLRTTVMNFGRTKTSKRPDYLYRVEADYTYRFLRALYSIRMGYGVVRSQGPVREGGTDSVPLFKLNDSREAGVDYGFAELRFRVNPKLDLDARAILGASDTDVVLGGAGRVRLGRELGAHVAAGIEIIPTLGYNATLRLQWDTVPHVLMAATLMTTSWPRTDRGDGTGIMLETLVPLGDRWRAGVEVGYAGRQDARGSVAASGSIAFEY